MRRSSRWPDDAEDSPIDMSWFAPLVMEMADSGVLATSHPKTL